VGQAILINSLLKLYWQKIVWFAMVAANLDDENGMVMRPKIPILAVIVSALVLGPAGSAFPGDPGLQPLQLAKLNNGQKYGSVKKTRKK